MNMADHVQHFSEHSSQVRFNSEEFASITHAEFVGVTLASHTDGTHVRITGEQALALGMTLIMHGTAACLVEAQMIKDAGAPT